MKFSSSEEKEEKYRRLIEGIKEYRDFPGSLIQMLDRAQDIFGYLPKEVLRFIAKETGFSSSRVYGVVTFYESFRLSPVGKYTIKLCLGTACHVRGASAIVDEIERLLGVKRGETTKDRKFTLQTVNCLGSCALGPVAVINGNYHGHLTRRRVGRVLKEYQQK
ncbi:MAG: NAD(P)H-dependent oxidoreductase subunit E [Candidatus Aerophobetes bacterium]